MTKTVIQLFARPPLKGKVKTRLSAKVGAENALSIYRHCLDFNLSLLRNCGFDYQIWLSEEPEKEWFPGENVKVQQGRNLGERMLFSMSSELQQTCRYDRVILIGSDCLDLTQSLLNQVETELDHNDLVIIPASDGGYVLIAARESINPRLFDDISWGSHKVMKQTQQRVMQSGIRASILNPLRDIDRIDDLQHYAVFQQYL